MSFSFKKDIEEIKKKSEEKRNSIFKDAEMLTVLWETEAEIIERILPPPLEPYKIPLVTAFVAYYPNTNQGIAYYESDLFIRCKFKEEYGNYHLAMHVTDDRAMWGGREICGFPKKIARIHLKRDGNKVEAYSERLGVKNIEINSKLEGKFNDPEAAKIIPKLLGKKGSISYNFKYFTSPDRLGFDYNPRLVKQITKLSPKSMEMGVAEIKLGSTAHDPWGELKIVKILGALYLKGTNIMFPGEVLTEVDPEKFLPYSFIKLDWY
ncbi:MAG: acetoacetate decarboxylase family protein [Candidatus Helarchaeota archaeon]